MLTHYIVDLIDDSLFNAFATDLFEVLDEKLMHHRTELQESLNEVINTSITGSGFFDVNDNVQKRGLVQDTKVIQLERLQRKLKVEKFIEVMDRNDNEIANAVVRTIDELNCMLHPETSIHNANIGQATKAMALSELIYEINRDMTTKLASLIREISK